ncbi:hypothetical protein HID58_083030 [Brassica napus]|uniref:DUF1985 domain-containing protein n=1 Tax=Brassica napus TaxID=3708 RepID=A0ABQ7YC83_BRANA|nr:hypothetical protein HID58_083030 [Brassica napus]
MRKPKSKKKVLVEDEETPQQYEVGDPSSPDLRLPPLLFATDRFPTRRHNIYSSPDLLPFIRNVLRDTPEFETIRRSCFGKLFDLPARQCHVSCKLIHAFLTRQLVCLPKNTLWSAFGGFPFRYGLEEFGTVTSLPCDGTLPQHKSINAIHIRRVEFDPNLVVTPIIPIESQPQPGWGMFPDDAKDDSVLYLEQLIAGQHSFNKHMWHGGVTSEPIIKKPKIRVKKKAATIKQSLQTRQPSAKKQRRISSYFTGSTTQSFTNVQLTEMVIQLSTQVKQLKREMKRRKKRSHARLSSFNKLLSRRKQSNTPPHTPEPSHNQDDAPMETDDMPQTTSPIISQYEAQLHRDSADDHLASSPVTDHCIHTESVHVSPNHNNTCAHPSPDHNVHPSQLSPVYATPPLSHLSLASSHTSDHLIHIQSVHVSPNHINACVHTSPDHNDDSRQVSPVFNKTPQPISVQPPWDELNSVVYDKSDHPNSPEINHILYHGVRIYDPINPDPPIFDSSIPRSLLLPSPQPKIILTSPTKSNDTMPGFAVHATTVNAFTATTSSESPPSLPFKVTESPPSLPFKDQNAHGVVDLTATKDVESHVPSLEESHLANELSKSPLIPAVTLISPLPGLEWDLFYNTVSTKMDVYHSTPSSFDFSNKFLLDLAKPKQWTSTRVRILSFLIPLNYTQRTYDH